jgi:putative ATPase
MSVPYNLFSNSDAQIKENSYVPLAEKCRPTSLDQIIGHQKILSQDSSFLQQIKSGKLQSLIFWGPPGVGKTTLARVIARELNIPSISISAVTSGKKELKEIADRANFEKSNSGKSTLLFIDEIHRFNKAQQDGLLHSVENGTLILIGATTENPSFEVISPLLSRCQVIKLESLNKEQLKEIIARAIKSDDVFSKLNIKLSGLDKLISLGSGDARKTLNLLEVCFNTVKVKNKKADITTELVKKAAESNVLYYDKKGDYHYDTISAFIKSVRGSDPDAAVYYLARMLEAGEDPMFIVRRLIILASEDIGNAEPYALSLATAAMQAVHNVGMPEARIILSQVTTYLASCPKSNAAYLAIDAALKDVKENPDASIPLHLRNAPTNLMKDEGYGDGYKYPHDFPQHFVNETYLPEKLKNKRYYFPSDLGREKTLKERLTQLWKNRFK